MRRPSFCEIAAGALPAPFDFSLIVFQSLAGPLDLAGSAARSWRFGAAVECPRRRSDTAESLENPALAFAGSRRVFGTLAQNQICASIGPGAPNRISMSGTLPS
jgi:hypothetical protein